MIVQFLGGARVPEPLGRFPGAVGGRIPGPIGRTLWDKQSKADASADKSTKKTNKPPALTKVDTIILHIYAPIIPQGQKSGDKGFSQQDYIDWFKAPDDPRIPDVGKWFTENINVESYTNTKSGVKDFEKSLQRKGAIAVYIGHSTLDSRNDHHSLGLSPQGGNQAEIPNARLRALLSKSTASLVIIASCDSKTAVGTPSAGPPIIVQNSGANRVTLIRTMANAVGTFLFLLIGWERDGQGQPNDPHKAGHATINEALAASAAEFNGMDDRFELVHGDGSIKVFP